ncbi:MAG: hypothetical protein KA807_16790 [Prolixibacteraceae bacterium]|nr:hypothetical protein [Prolixibacteraceae bacterium]
MNNIRDKMRDFENSIKDFIKNHPNVTAASFPFKDYKSLNETLYNIHIEMSSKNSGINLEEGINWFREQIKKLTDFLP